MAVVEVISNLKDQFSERQEQYAYIVKSLSENAESACEGLNSESFKSFCDKVFEDLKNEASESPHAVKCLQCFLQNKHLQKIFTDSEKVEVIKNLINCIDSSLHENVLINYFSVLIQISPSFNLDNDLLKNLLLKMDDVLSKKSAVSAYFLICNYFQKFLKDYEGKLSNFIPVLSKLVFVPLCHPSTKVREVAEKTLDMFPKLLLYTPDEEASSALLKLVKESYSKDLLLLFKDKQELYALKVWKHVVNALGSTLPANLPVITPFFQVIEKGFKSPIDEVCIASFTAWKSLISCFAGTDGVLNDSKKLRFILKPFKNISRSSENILLNACDAWWYLAWNLAEHLSSRFTEVCIPLIELTVGKITNGHPEKIPKGGPLPLLKKCCYILLRFLEQPSSDAINRISSPKKLPHVPYPALQSPLELKIITHHFKEILYAFRIVIDIGGTREDMKNYLEYIMKSILYIVSTLIEDSNKESVEAVTAYLNFIADVIEAKVYPSVLCLKCIESLSKFSRKVLVSHHFNCGSRTSQDILSISLLKLLFNSHLFPSENPKSFSATYNRLVQAGMQESFHPLLITQKFMHVIRMAIGTNSVDVEILIEVWSGIATPLLEIIEKTQEVNQGDKQEHDFSCMYDVLIFPFEYIFPVYLQQFRSRPAFKLWTTVYKAFIRSASLVPTIAINEPCENFCSKLGACLKEESVKKPHLFELVCLFMQVIVESFDFSSGNASGTQGIMDVALMIKRKKPLGNFTSFVDILSLLLKTYHTFIEEEVSDQANTPINQRRLQILKSAAPLDLVKSFFGNIKSGGIISFVLEQLADPLSKLFLQSSQKRNLVNHIDAKLEIMWNVITSTIERHYLGPYDSDFLAVMSPLLETTFSHTKRHVKEKSRRFWFATFGPNASSLKLPDSLKNVLKKINLPLLPDGMISPTEFSVSPLTESVPNSVSEACVEMQVTPVLQSTVAKAFPVKNTPFVNGEASKVNTKESKQSSKVSIDDLPIEEFVKIESQVVPNAFKRRSIRKKKSFVPTMYSDLSQDMSNMTSSLDSQDTISDSAPLEEPAFKVPMVENKEASEKEPVVPMAINQKETHSGFKTVPKSPMAAKFQESLDKSLRTVDVLNLDSEVISIESSGSDCEINDRNSKKSHLDSDQKLVKSEIELMNEKISVFSIPGEKRAQPRSTRRNARLSQSFCGTSDKKSSENKLEFQKLNKSCIELIHLSDSEEIIPSSQSSTDNETSIKFSNSGNTSPNLDFKKSSPDFNEAVKQTFKNVTSPEKDCIEKSFEEFIGENVKSKHELTSTPAKSKGPKFDDNYGECEKPDDKRIKVISNDMSELTSNCASNCDELIQPLDKEIKDKLVDSPKNMESEPKAILNDKNDDIKDINFLLDAVDDLQKIQQSTGNYSKVFESLPDKDMKDIPLPEVENKTSSLILGDDKSSSTPVKKTRLSIKLTRTDPCGSDDYSQKLRRKTVSVASNQQIKSRKRKSLKEIPADSYKKAVIEDDKGDFIVCDKKATVVDKAEDIVFSDNKLKEKSILDEPLMDKSKEKIDEFSENKTSIIEVYHHNLANAHSSETVLETKKDEGFLNELDNCKEKELSVNNKHIPSLSLNALDVVPLQVNKLDSLKNEQRRKSLRKSLFQPSKSQEKNQEVCLAEKSNSSCLDSHVAEESGKPSISHKIPSKFISAVKRKKSITDLSDEKNSRKKITKDQSEICNVQPGKDQLVKNVVVEVEMLEKSNIDQEIQPETQMDTEEENCDVDEAKKSNKEVQDILGTNEADMSPQGNDELNNLTQGNEIQNKDDEISDTLHCAENAESCDIFDLCSENSCKEFPDSENIPKSVVSLGENKSVAKMIETPCSPSSPNEDSHLIPVAIEENKFADVITIKITSSSLENYSNSDISPNLVDSNEISSKSITIVPVETKEKDAISNKTVDDKSDSLCIQFSDTEDDCNNEIQNIVKLIVDASIDSNDIIESKSTISNKDNADSQHLGTSKEKIEKNCNSVSIHQNHDHPEKNVSLSQSSQNDSFENTGPIILSWESHASMIPNDHPCQELEMDIVCVNDSNKEKSIKSSSENKLNTISNEIMSSEHGFHPQMEHSYFNKNPPTEISSDMNETETENNLKGEIISPVSGKVSMTHFSGNDKTEEFIQISKVYFENEIKCVMKELVILVEKLNLNYKRGDVLEQDYYDADFSNHDENSAGDSNHVADKENHIGPFSDGDKLAKGSKKRKNKAPIRSAFNFRRRGKMDISKPPLTKVTKKVNVSESDIVVSHCSDLTITPVFPKIDISNENSENSMTKIISSIVDSITETETGADFEVLPSSPCSSQMSRSQRIELSNDELTDLNTRLNASSAPQTRRSKLIAATQKNISDIDCGGDTLQSDVVIVCSEDSNSNLSSILKKKKVPPVPKHLRRVTFASPLIQELVFESFSETKGIETITMSSLQTLSKKRKKILLEKIKAEKVTPPPPQSSVESQEVPSSSEYQDSDVLDFCDLPVSPAFINCQDSISLILKDLTSPSWVRALESLLLSKNIKTIGDVCKLNIHQLKALPFKSPKVLTLHKALVSYLNQTQESMLEKFKTIDDGSSESEAASVDASSTASTSSGIPYTPHNTVSLTENEEMKLLEETVLELLRSGKLKDLHLSLLGELVENCGKTIAEKYRNYS